MATVATTYVSSSRVTREWFYVWMGGICMLLPLGGFFGTYLVPVATGTFNRPTILHLHALLTISWIGLFVLQSWLIARGQVVRHRAMGLAGIALATATFFTGAIVTIKAMNRGIAAGDEHSARALAIVSLTVISMFAGLFAAAIVNIRRPEYHKRLMLMSTIAIMPPALARLIAMAATRSLLGSQGVGAESLPVTTGFAFATLVGVATDLLVVVAMVYDWRTRGRPHRVYWIAGAIIIAIQTLRIPIGTTGAWMGFTEMLSSLAQ